MDASPLPPLLPDKATGPDLRIVPSPPADAARRGVRTAVVPRRRWRRWVIGVLAVVVIGAAGVEAWRASRATATVRYATAPVTRGAVTRVVTASGSVNPMVTIQVGTYVSGVIKELYCDFNTQVRKGQLCAKIDPRPYQTIVDQDRANLSTAKAQLAKDQTNLAYTKLSYNRAVELAAEGLVSQDALDSAKSVFDQASAQVELDRSAVQQRAAVLEAAEVNLAYTDIVSPVNGTVVSRNVTTGQTVAASFQTPTLFLIATDLTKMQVDANVSESDIGGIAVGNGATFTVEAFPRRVFEGEVTQVRQAPQAVQNVVTYDVVISAANPDRLLKPGMTATVRIVVAQRNDVLRIPERALRYTPSAAGGGVRGASGERGASRGETRVWVLRGGSPVAITVRTGLDDDMSVEVLEGDLKPGDEVVTGEEAATGSGAARRIPFFRL